MMHRSLRQPRALFSSKIFPVPIAPSILRQSIRSRPSLLPRTSTLLPSQYVSFFHHQTCRRQQAAAAAIEAEAEQEMAGARPPSDEDVDKQLDEQPITRFAQLGERGLVSQKLINTLTRTMGLETMTEVQSKTINNALDGTDVLAQAKTGTGKTIGFLLPILQNILSVDPQLEQPQDYATRRYSRGNSAADIRAIVISPTRELAEQIATEAKKMVKGTGVVIQTAVGGTQKGKHLGQMQREGCHILVGTPGRLKDIFSDRATGVSAPKLSAFVLDEADRLLDAGFWPEIQEIQRLLPSKQERDRQTLMFSATVPKDVVDLVRKVMKPNLHYVKSVQDDEAPTHERVKQSVVTVPGLENQLPAVLELCNREIMARNRDRSLPPFKAIIYFNATAETTLSADLIFKIRQRTEFDRTSSSPRDDAHDTSILGSYTRVYSIHSRLTQGARTAAADHFRDAKSAVLCSSDVTARGMDFPNVTHVIQVGLPPTRDSYIHRLGRTGRAGREGEGWLILPQLAKRELNYRLGKMPLQPDSSLSTASVDLSASDFGRETHIPPQAAAFFDAIAMAAQRVDPESFQKTYMAMLGTGQWVHDKALLIEQMNRLARVQWGLKSPPAIAKGLANKLGLSKVVGMNLEADRSRPREIRDYGSRESSGGGNAFYGGKGGPDQPDRRGGDRYRGRGGGFGGRDASSAFERSPRDNDGFGAREERPQRSFEDRRSSSGGGGYDGKRRSEREGSREFNSPRDRNYGDRNDRTRRKAYEAR